ncbi:MAG: trypsin-like serine protease [Pseudomonadota bacterium]
MKISLLAAAVCAALGLSNGTAANAQSTNVKNVTGWEAVGRLNMNNRAMCTGALIAPDTVLTAAHCLFDPRNGRPVAAGTINFEAGFLNGRAKAARGVVETIIHPGYRHNHGGSNDANVDVALLKLSEPISPTIIRPFATDVRPELGDQLGVISYTYTRKNRPMLQQPCNVLARKADVLVMNCEVDFGASGAPVFAVQGGERPRLVSVISSKAAMGNRPVSVGTIVENALQVLLNRAG